MDRKDLHIYKDKIKKLHKAALVFEQIHDDFNLFQKESLFNEDFDLESDWDRLIKFKETNPDLDTMLDEVTEIIKVLGDD
jgi:hypothetical protein